MTPLRWSEEELADARRKAEARRLKFEPYIRTLVARDRPKPPPSL